jgi:hypothetical protein
MPRSWRRSKKLRRACGGNPREARTRRRGLVPRRDAGGPKEQAHWPGKVHARGPRTINGPNRPICSVRSAPNVVPAPPSCCRPATAKPCSSISRDRNQSRFRSTRLRESWMRENCTSSLCGPVHVKTLRSQKEQNAHRVDMWEDERPCKTRMDEITEAWTCLGSG